MMILGEVLASALGEMFSLRRLYNYILHTLCFQWGFTSI